MDIDIDNDRKYNDEAISALENYLIGYETSKDIENLGLTTREIIDIYMSSRNVLRENPESNQLRLIANTVFWTCIRVVRCLFLQNSDACKTIIEGHTYSLDVLQQIKIMRREYQNMTKIE